MDEKSKVIFFTSKIEDKTDENSFDAAMPEWVLSGKLLNERVVKLSNEIAKSVANLEWENHTIPLILSVKLIYDIHAESDRSEIAKVFFTDKNNVIGLNGENTLLVSLDSLDEANTIIKNIEKRSNDKGVSCIEGICKYKASVDYDENVENYKVSLFDFGNEKINEIHMREFENLLDAHNLRYRKTNYSKSLIIYKVLCITKDSLEILSKDSRFDLVKKIEPMPSISV